MDQCSGLSARTLHVQLLALVHFLPREFMDLCTKVSSFVTRQQALSRTGIVTHCHRKAALKTIKANPYWIIGHALPILQHLLTKTSQYARHRMATRCISVAVYDDLEPVQVSSQTQRCIDRIFLLAIATTSLVACVLSDPDLQRAKVCCSLENVSASSCQLLATNMVNSAFSP